MKKLLAGLFFCAYFFIITVPARAANPDIIEVTSLGGIKAWLVQDDRLPLISMSFAFRGGVEQDPADKQGLSALATSLLTQGAGSYNDRAFQDQLAARSISMSIDAGRDYIQGEVKTLRREKDAAFRLLNIALTKPRFDAAAFARAKRQQATAVRMQLSEPSWQGRYALYQAVFGNHPYGYRALGSATSLDRITQQDVVVFMRGRLAKDNLFIAVVGAISPKELTSLLDKTFGALPRQAMMTDVPLFVWPQQAMSVLVPRDGAQTDISFAMPMLRRDDPDWYAAEIANYIIGGGGFSSRLMKTVRVQKGLTYGIGTGLASMDRASILMGQVATDNSKTAEAWALTQKVWQDFYARGVSEEEIIAARDYLTGSLPLALTSTDAIAGVLVRMQTQKLGRDFLDKRNKLFEKVTAQDVGCVIQKWFDPARISLSYVGKPENVAAEKMREPVSE